jgi:hypothetical protein
LVGDDLIHPLAADVRQRFGRFLQDTERFRTPASRSQIEDEIAALMIVYRSARAIGVDEADEVSRQYAEVLADLPIWAIRQGFALVKRGEAEGVNLDFPPSAPRLRDVVKEAMRPLMLDRYQITKVLSARAVPDDRLLPAPPTPQLKSMRPSIADLKAKYGENWGIGGILPANEIAPTPRAPKEPFVPLQGDALVEYYRTHNLRGALKQQHDDACNGEEVSNY